MTGAVVHVWCTWPFELIHVCHTTMRKCTHTLCIIPLSCLLRVPDRKTPKKTRNTTGKLGKPQDFVVHLFASFLHSSDILFLKLSVDFPHKLVVCVVVCWVYSGNIWGSTLGLKIKITCTWIRKRKLQRPSKNLKALWKPVRTKIKTIVTSKSYQKRTEQFNRMIGKNEKKNVLGKFGPRFPNPDHRIQFWVSFLVQIPNLRSNFVDLSVQGLKIRKNYFTSWFCTPLFFLLLEYFS